MRTSALGDWARVLLLAGAVISMLGHAGAMILAAPRTLFPFARNGFLPAALARTHPVHRTPVAGILVLCAIVGAGHTTTFVMACLVIGWMLTSVTAGEWTAFGVALAVGTAIFLVRLRLSSPSGSPAAHSAGRRT